MCGIAGIFSPMHVRKSAQTDIQSVRRMIGTITHRGPDAEGIWTDPKGRCVLGHRRLSIIDTSDVGRQPRISGDNRWVITFNGELYNYRDLTQSLRAAGTVLKTRTDTEVLLESVALWGEDVISRFDGMFAFAVFDAKKGDLLLARDPFGEKPLYFTELDDGRIAFASELQALEEVSGFDPSVDVNALAEMLTFQYIGAPRSIYRSVKKVPPGTWVRIKADGRKEFGRYFAYRPGLSGFVHRSIPDLADELEDILLRSISRRLMSDVPLGAFLSGGVDSSVACALIRRRLGIPLKTFSIGFEGAPESEHAIARAFAEHLGTTHYDEFVNPDISTFLFEAGRLLDEPNGDSSCLPTYLLSRFARQHVTVAISGDGGDEMFGGYGRYFATLDDQARHNAGELPGWAPGDVYYGNRIVVANEPYVADVLGFVPPAFAEHLRRLRGAMNAASGRLLCEMRRQDAEHYMPGAVLPKVDRMSMRHALEVRTPYLNVELARFAERLPDSVLVSGNRGKLVLRELAYRYLPRQLIDLPKAGFGVPMSDWARGAILSATDRLINGKNGRLREAFGAEGLSQFLKQQHVPGHFSPYQVWALAVLESWLRRHPARLPDFGGKGKLRSIAAAENRVLYATHIGKDTYLIARADLRAPLSDEPVSTATYIDWLHLSLDNDFGWQASDLTEGRSLVIPDWGTPLTPKDKERLAVLRGATLLFADVAAIDRCDDGECQKFADLGVSRLVFRPSHNPNQLIELRFRNGLTSPLQRTLSIAWLFGHRVGLISNGPWLRWLGAVPYDAAEDGLNRSEPIRKIEPLPNKEYWIEYAVFSGTRQLTPLPASNTHADVTNRYSIQNQQLIFPRQGTSLDPLWLVKCSDRRSASMLPMLAHHTNRRPLSTKQSSELLAELLAPDDRPFYLEPGDPIVICTHALPSGGAERQWVYLAQTLQDLGYRVTFVVYEPMVHGNAHYLPMIQESGIKLIDGNALSQTEQFELWPPNRSPEFLRLDIVPAPAHLLFLTAAFNKIRPKVVYCQLDHPNIVAGFAALIAGVPRYVMSFRNYNPTNFSYLRVDWFLPAYRELVKSPRVMMAGNFREANDDYAQWIGVSSRRVACIPNAINEKDFLPPTEDELRAIRAELRIELGIPVILGVFRLSEEKDPAVFVDVCKRVIGALPATRAFIAGVGMMQDSVAAYIAEVGMSDRIRLLGQRSDVRVLMKAASVLLLTSRHEGMPNVLLEAQLMATPIVATTAGGVRDVVLDGQSAVVCPIGDVTGLSEAVLTILRDPVRAVAMGERGHSHVRKSFSKRQLAEGYLAVARGEHLTRDNGRQAREGVLLSQSAEQPVTEYGQPVTGPYRKDKLGVTGLVGRLRSHPRTSTLWLVRNGQFIESAELLPGYRIRIPAPNEPSDLSSDNLRIVPVIEQALERPFEHVRGNIWRASVPVLVDETASHPSKVVFFENGRQLATSHVSRDDIANLGVGQFSHWGLSIYFSSSDASDPNKNGRKYLVLSPVSPSDARRSSTQGVATRILTGPFVYHHEGWRTPADGISNADSLYLIRDGLPVGRAQVDEANYIRIASRDESWGQVYGSEFGLAEGQLVEVQAPFLHEQGFLWSCAVPELDWTIIGDVQPILSMFEDLTPLPFADAKIDDIARFGAGRYSYAGRKMHFSTLDGSDPNRNGRRYFAFVNGPFAAKTRIAGLLSGVRPDEQDGDGLLNVRPVMNSENGSGHPIIHYPRRNGTAKPDNDISVTLRPEAVATGMRPLAHHLGTSLDAPGGLRAAIKNFRWQADLLRNAGAFDEAWYLKKYPDVALAHVDPVHHYLTRGAIEGRNPTADFDTRMYLMMFPELASSGLNPFVHSLLMKGWELPSYQIKTSEMSQEVGVAWTVDLSDRFGVGDTAEGATSTLLLYENDRLLTPSHALHDVIRQVGGGAYSHWSGVLRFSTSDGSDPRTNGRRYWVCDMPIEAEDQGTDRLERLMISIDQSGVSAA